MFMAEWEHKERNWSLRTQDDASGKPVSAVDGIRQKGNPSIKYERNSNYIEFADWLDMQCKGGWEVFKISRDYNSGLRRTWCIFRRLV